ncbi:hypothetical protein RvY_10846 [Ramazzottius varieornatus]|uniref:Uncharacterized protein n=1 Tax=Ramazzottius varieornatus TaxID=947166 RepID=A0A1D1VE47_RAMVA|nr:hypothetical protein RvY_10846 [Ramazzottius varieornatus]
MGRYKEVATDVETSQTPAKKSRKPRAVREHASDNSQPRNYGVWMPGEEEQLVQWIEDPTIYCTREQERRTPRRERWRRPE